MSPALSDPSLTVSAAISRRQELDPHTPRSRLKLAIPFVGKDVPSTASEFAHPDIIIGLTVLAYRYGARRAPSPCDCVVVCNRWPYRAPPP